MAFSLQGPVADGRVRRQPDSPEQVAARQVGAQLVSLRLGPVAGIAVTDAAGRRVSHRQFGLPDCTGDGCERMILSDVLPVGGNGIYAREIGVAMETAIRRAFSDGMLSEKEARQFVRVAGRISRALRDEDFSDFETQRIVHGLGRISRTGRS